MSIWSVISNIGKIMSFFKAIQSIVESLIKKEQPSKEQIKSLLSQLQVILKSKVVDFPGVDEDQIADAVKQIEDQLFPS